MKIFMRPIALLLVFISVVYTARIPSFRTEKVKGIRYDDLDLLKKIARHPPLKSAFSSPLYLSSLLFTQNIQFDLFCENPRAALCTDVGDTIRAIEVVVSNAIQIHQPIKLHVEVASQCKVYGNCGGATLAGATPMSFWTFQNHPKIDPRYRYPQALAKQLVTDASVEWAEYDIFVTVNSDNPYTSGGSRFWFDRLQEPISHLEYDLRIV
jgi:hypothetical protein